MPAIEVSEELERRVQSSCVVFKRGKQRVGTGFFISPTAIITCAHVVREEKTGTNASASLECFHALNRNLEKIDLAHVECPLPDLDLALLSVRSYHSPQFLSLNPTVSVGDSCYCWGFSKNNPAGDPAHPRVAGTTGASPELEPDPFKRGLLKLDDAHIAGGHSGSPLINLRSQKVCGVMRETRSESSPYGGYAIPIRSFLPFLSNLIDITARPIVPHAKDGANTKSRELVSILAAINEPVPKLELGVLLGVKNTNSFAAVSDTDSSVLTDQGEVFWLSVAPTVCSRADERFCADAADRLRTFIGSNDSTPATRRLWRHLFLLEKRAKRTERALTILKRIIQPDYLELHPVEQCWNLVSDFDLANASDPTRAYVLNVQSVLLREMGDLLTSQDKCEQALRLCEPTSALSLIVSQNLAHLLFECGEVEEALNQLTIAGRRSLNASRDSSARRMSQSASRRDHAIMLAQLGQFDEAASLLSEDIEIADAAAFQRSWELDRAFLAYVKARVAFSEGKRKEGEIDIANAFLIIRSLPISTRIRESLDREFLLGCLCLQEFESSGSRVAEADARRFLLSALTTARELGLRMLQAEVMLALARLTTDTKLGDTAFRLMERNWMRLSHLYLSTSAVIAAKQRKTVILRQNRLLLKNSPFLAAKLDLSYAESLISAAE
jgi:tetratricopeptide (TPR) repeat protein/S1-C subfamily serine protease